MIAAQNSEEINTARLAEGIANRDDPPWWWVALQLTALSFHVPLSLMSGTQRALASVSGSVAVGVGVTALFVLLFWIFSRLLNSGWRSLAIVSAGAVLFWHGSGLAAFAGGAAWFLNLLVAGLVLTAAYRNAGGRLFKLSSFVASVTVGTTLLLLVVLDALFTPGPVVEVRNPIESVNLSSTPNIFLVVLDGYGRSDVLDDLFNFDNTEFLTKLKAQGFDVAESSSANYTITHLSLPSLLNMSYMNEPLDYMHNSDLEKLAQATSGDNTFVQILKSHGYTYVHGDSDHWFNTCGPMVDICLEGPLLDVTGHSLLAATPVGDLFYPISGDPTTALNRMRIGQMTNWGVEGPQVVGPTFTFLHLVLPHPPLFMDSNCEMRIDEDLRERVLNSGATPPEIVEKRKEAWVRQVECANKAILDFLPNIQETDIVVLTSDHGPDSSFVIETTDPKDLTQERLGERLPNLTAAKLSGDCAESLPPDVHSVNVLRIVLDCLSGDDIELLEDRYFAATFGGSIIELSYSNAAGD